MKAKSTLRVFVMVLLPAPLALPSCGGDDDDDSIAVRCVRDHG